VQLEEMIQDFILLGTGFGQLLKQRQKTLKQVQGNLIEARMVTAGQLLNQFPRMIRDLCAKENKLVKLELNGSHTLIDKAILDKLYDPLVHLIRNAFDHGCETAAERKAFGKSEVGSIAISVYHRGDQTLITVSDDGRGISVETIRQRIINLGWLSPQSTMMLTTESLYDYLFRSGFSTSETISELSGRGMGLSAVKLQVESLKGSIEVSSQLGLGTTFTLRLPLTLTITKLLVFRLGALLLAIPIASLVSIVVADSKDIETHQGKDYYLAMGRRVPFYPINWLTTYNYPLASNAAPTIPGQEWYKSEKITLLLIARGEDRIALKIDRIVRSQDLVIKPFNELISPPATLSGCTLLGDGSLVPVLDGAALVEKWRRHYEAEKAYTLVPSSPQISLPLIQIVDDSLTIRQTLAATLRKAGYQVVQARDGWEALGQLQQNLDIRAIICDIEMPRMNGLELLSRLRGDSRNPFLGEKRIPVIVLTSRSGEKHRQLAQRMGADSYIVKPYVERELLDTLETFLVKA
jgi:chemotaxis family two-component system sensor histidine kinase/response regulator PixL